MDLSDAAFTAPLILRALCYMGGMAFFICALSWLGRLALGYGNSRTLSVATGLWAIRILTGMALLSLCSMIFSWRQIESPAHMLPEISILLLVFAYYKMTLRPGEWRREPLAVAGVFIFCVAAWAASFGLGWLLFHFMPPTPGVLIVCLLWNGSLLGLYLYAVKTGRAGNVKFHNILWPVILAYMLFLLPDYAERLGNSAKIRALMNPSPPIIRV